MPAIGPYTISIIINGRSLHEYEPPADEISEVSENKTMVYVEVAEGMKFGVKFNVKGPLSFPTGYIGVYLTLDNRTSVWQPISKCAYYPDCELTHTFDACRYPVGPTWVERDFQFGNLTTTDTVPESEDLKKIASNTGTIQVLVCNQTAPKLLDTAGNSTYFAEKMAVPEKALKGQPIDLATVYGEARTATKRMVRIDSKRVGEPLLHCVFKYRSRKALQMLDLIPVTPEPIALHERDPNTLSLVEARELLSQMQKEGRQVGVLKKEQPSVKQEQDSNVPQNFPQSNSHKRKWNPSMGEQDISNDDDLIFVGAKKIKTTPTSQAEVVDLS